MQLNDNKSNNFMKFILTYLSDFAKRYVKLLSKIKEARLFLARRKS